MKSCFIQLFNFFNLIKSKTSSFIIWQLSYFRNSFIGFLLTLFFILLLLPIKNAEASDVLIVLEANLRPYVEALNGVKNVVGDKAMVVSIQDLLEEQRQKELNIQEIIESYHPRIIVTIGSQCLLFLMNKTDHIPIVFTMVLNPWSFPFSRPLITGISMNVLPKLYWQVFSLIKPKIHTIGVVYDPSKTGFLVKIAKKLVKQYHQKLIAIPVKTPVEAIRAIQKIVPNIDAFWMTPDTTVYRQEALDFLIYSSICYHFVLAGLSIKDVRSGSLFAWSFNSYKLGEQAGRLVNKILNGGDFPHKKFFWAGELSLSINLKIAKKIGIEIDKTLINKAQVIK